MINPTPVNTKSSPYGGNRSRGSLPKAISLPPEQPKKKKGFSWKRLFSFSLIFLILGGGTYAYAYVNGVKNEIIVSHQGDSSSILSYDPGTSLANINASQFKQAGDGRFNVVMVGVGGDNHPGGNLTDSIQVLSVDTINKKVGITSVPRDLYVNIPGYGYSKINAAYSVGEQRKAGDGGYLLRQVVGNVLGINISNFVLLDFSGAEELVDTLGGIDVNVPKAISDPYFPDDRTIGYSPFYISAGPHHMDGHTALRYSRSRETTSDFDRSARQQIVMGAIKSKALSLGTLTNPVTVTSLINTLGKHIRTDMQTNDIQRFINIYKDIPSGDTSTNVLDTSASLGLLTSGSGTAAGYISYPLLGMTDFSAVRAWFQKNNPDPLIAKESSTITVTAGGSTTSKQAQALVDILKSYGYNAMLSPSSYTGNLKQTTLYDASSDKKPFSHNYLTTYFGGTTQSGSPLSSGSDFEVIYFASTKK